MKAEKTTELIELSIAMNTGNVPYDPKRLHDLCFESDEELSRLERLAEVGRATEKAFNDPHAGRLYVWDENFVFAKRNVIKSIHDLLRWDTHEEKSSDSKLDDIAGRQEG